MDELNLITTETENFNKIVKWLKFNPEKADEFSKIRFCDKNCPMHANIEACVSKYFEKHPLFKILTEPLSLCLAASQLQLISIAELYEKIVESKFINEKDDALLMNII